MKTTERKFWFVWNTDGRAPQFRHWTRPAALAEAERLARANPTESFVVLESIGTARVPETPVAWSEHTADDDTPFRPGD